MLVLSRKLGERIHIGDDVFVEVRRVAGNRVTLAVSAPRNVRILRGELMNVDDALSVLDEEAEHSQSTTDTVIMKHAGPGNSVAASSSDEEAEQSTASFSI
jgi:carbon storage regulator CsrA